MYENLYLLIKVETCKFYMNYNIKMSTKRRFYYHGVQEIRKFQKCRKNTLRTTNGDLLLNNGHVALTSEEWVPWWSHWQNKLLGYKVHTLHEPNLK